MASSSITHPQMKDEKQRNWAELPSELLALILYLLGPVDILESAQRVCRSWRLVSKEPSLWRKIDIRNVKRGRTYVRRLCRLAVSRSEGGLVEINLGNFGSNGILNYIANRSGNLRSLGIGCFYQITYEGIHNALAKLPLLEELELSRKPSLLDLKAIGRSRPKLKSLKLNCTHHLRKSGDDEEALAIAESMHELRHLQLIGNRLTNTGLNTILDKCPHLEHLDLRQCLNINLTGDIEKRCLERIKYLRRPNDSIADYSTCVPFWDINDSDDDYEHLYMAMKSYFFVGPYGHYDASDYY